VRLQKLFDQQTKEEWLPLFPSNSNLNHKQVGEVRVSMQLILTSQAKEVKLKKKVTLSSSFPFTLGIHG